MNLFGFFVGVAVTVAGGVILYWVIVMIERPKLEMIAEWQREKWVGALLRKNYNSTSNEVEFIGDGCDFIFYGIKIENKARRLLPRKSANIKKTTITVFDACGIVTIQERDCRWWSPDMAEIDNLFIPSQVDINQRKNIVIPDGVNENLVIAYRSKNGSSYYRFAIDSDRRERFVVIDDKFNGQPPYYALIKIGGDDNARAKIKLRIFLGAFSGDLSIEKIKKFPFE
jgi:hypothetical protein